MRPLRVRLRAEDCPRAPLRGSVPGVRRGVASPGLHRRPHPPAAACAPRLDGLRPQHQRLGEGHLHDPAAPLADDDGVGRLAVAVLGRAGPPPLRVGGHALQPLGSHPGFSRHFNAAIFLNLDSFGLQQSWSVTEIILQSSFSATIKSPHEMEEKKQILFFFHLMHGKIVIEFKTPSFLLFIY